MTIHHSAGPERQGKRWPAPQPLTDGQRNGDHESRQHTALASHLPWIARHTNLHRTVIHQGSRFVHARFAGDRRPDEAQLRHLRGVNLIHWAIAPAVVRSANNQPVAVRRIFQSLRGDGLMILQKERNGHRSSPLPPAAVGWARLESCVTNKPTLIPSTVARPPALAFWRSRLSSLSALLFPTDLPLPVHLGSAGVAILGNRGSSLELDTALSTLQRP